MSLFQSYSCLPQTSLQIPSDDGSHYLVAELQDWIRDNRFPCIGAKAALSRDQICAIVLPDIRSSGGDQRLHAALLGFIARVRRKPRLFQSFAAIFEKPRDLEESVFEQSLWQRIQSVSDRDIDLGHSWDQRVSSDPISPHFSLSFAGEAFFVVGMHPHASRPARRFHTPVLVFNTHAQFERLRAEGRYERLRETIVGRDIRLAGSVNPMLQRYGEVSEARQYSGRAVTGDWSCPFKRSSFAIRQDDNPH